MIGLNDYSRALANVASAAAKPATSTPAQASKTRALLNLPVADAWQIVIDATKAADYPASALEAVIWSVLAQGADELHLAKPAENEAFDPERIASSFRALAAAASPAPIKEPEPSAETEPIATEPKRILADMKFTPADKAAAEKLSNNDLLSGLRFARSEHVADYKPRGFAAMLEVALARAQQPGSGLTLGEVQNEICTLVSESSSVHNDAVLALAAKACDPAMLYFSGLETVSPAFMRNASGAHHVINGGMSGSESSFRNDMFQIGIRGAKLGADTMAQLRKKFADVPHLVKTLAPDAVAAATERGAKSLLEQLRTGRFVDGRDDFMGRAAAPAAATAVLWNLEHPRIEPEDERFKDYGRPDYSAYLTAEQLMPALTIAYENNLGNIKCSSSVRSIRAHLNPTALIDIDRRVFIAVLARGDAQAVYAIYDQTSTSRDRLYDQSYEFLKRVPIADFNAKSDAAVHTMLARLGSEQFADDPYGSGVNPEVSAMVGFILGSKSYRDSQRRDADNAFGVKVRDTLRGLHERSRRKAPHLARYLEQHALLRLFERT